jgi:hypothetical protein
MAFINKGKKKSRRRETEDHEIHSELSRYFLSADSKKIRKSRLSQVKIAEFISKAYPPGLLLRKVDLDVEKLRFSQIRVEEVGNGEISRRSGDGA